MSVQVSADGTVMDVELSTDELFTRGVERHTRVVGTMLFSAARPLTHEVVYVRVAATGTEGWSLPTSAWTVASTCGDLYYLHDFEGNDPATWGCRRRPDGASCAGAVAWGGVRALFGFWRVPGEARKHSRPA